jgi:hypothetical protein
MALEQGDIIRSGNSSNAEIACIDGSTVELQAGTEIQVASLAITDTGSATIVLNQIIGSIIFRVIRIIDPGSRYEVLVPGGAVAARGSAMQVTVTEDGTTQACNLEGNIWAIAQGVELQIPQGQCCIIRLGQPPELIIIVRTWYDLDAIRNNLGSDYTLVSNLNSTTAGYAELASSMANGGKGWQPIGAVDNGFTGTFDGQGYEIGDLFLDRPDEGFTGLFRCVGDGGVIRDIGMTNVTVTGQINVGCLVGENNGTVVDSYAMGSVNGWGNLGGLVGFSYGTVISSRSSGSVIGDWIVGGLVGHNWEGTVTNSYSTSSVSGQHEVGGLVGENIRGTVSNSYSSGNATGEDWYIGGLVGTNNNATVTNSYSTSSVSGGSHTGGLVGLNVLGGAVSNSYSKGSVSGSYSVGGLVGENISGGTVSNSFWDTQTSGQATSAGGTGKNTTEMQDMTTFSGATWNITAVANPDIRNLAYIWNIVNSVTYPFLSWQP